SASEPQASNDSAYRVQPPPVLHKPALFADRFEPQRREHPVRRQIRAQDSPHYPAVLPSCRKHGKREPEHAACKTTAAKGRSEGIVDTPASIGAIEAHSADGHALRSLGQQQQAAIRIVELGIEPVMVLLCTNNSTPTRVPP